MRRSVGVLLGVLMLLGGAEGASAQKVSETPVSEIEKVKNYPVDQTLQAIEPDAFPEDLPLTAVPVDSSALVARPVPADALDRFLSDPDYQYERVENTGPSPWDLFWRWLDRVLWQPIAESVPATFWDWFWPLLALVVLALVVARLFQAGGASFFSRRDDADPEGAVLLDTEDIEAIDLDRLLAQASAESRYRDAVRFLYLLTLQRLAGQGLIAWHKHKTNRDYVNEVRTSAPALVTAFAEVTRLFAWVWYGEAPLDAARFEAVQARFEAFRDARAGTRTRATAGAVR